MLCRRSVGLCRGGVQIANLNELVMEVAWAPGHADELLEVLTGKAIPKRRKQQDFSSSTSYMSASLWPKFVSPSNDLHAKADFIVNFGADLGCKPGTAYG